MAGSPGTPPAVALPPGPSVRPVVQTVAFHRDPLGVLGRSRSRYGPVFTLRQPVVGATVVVADPAAVESLLAADRAGEARRRMLPMASPRSVFGGDGNQHRAAREHIWRAFAGETVARHRAAMARLTEEHVAGWPRGRPFRLLPRVRTLIDEIFIRHIVGVEERESRALVAAIRRMLWTPGNPPIPIPGPGNQTLTAPADLLLKWRSAPVTRLLGDAIDRRRASGGGGDDVIGALLRSAPDQPTGSMVDELLTVLMAGQEPPAVAVTRVLDRLARDATVRDRFLAADAPYRDAAVREELRLHPPALAVLRWLTASLEVAGHSLPAGADVMLPIPLLQRDPQAVTLRPLRSQPERMVVRATTLVPHRSALVTAA